MLDAVTPDPFALQAHVVHDALAQNNDIGADIDPGLFDKFLHSPAFRAWSTGNTSWQLHCYGEPGCGKVSPSGIVLCLCMYVNDHRLRLLLLLQVGYPRN